MPRTILIVEDDSTQRSIIKHVLIDKLGYKAVALARVEEAIHYLNDRRTQNPDMCLLDYELEDQTALDILAHLRKTGLEIPSIVITAFGDTERAMNCMRAGADDFLTKPVQIERLNISIRNAFDRYSLRRQLRMMEQRDQNVPQFEAMIGRSEAWLQAVEYGKKAAALDTCLLIEGAEGVGKLLFARTIHASGARRRQPFVIVDCKASAEQDMETVLFGVQEGVTFTRGKFHEAEHGTLYLAHVEALPLSAQARLLAAIQDREILPVQGAQAQKLQVRLITSSDGTLEARSQQGEFRSDLYHRLRTMHVRLPSLEERRDDIQLLARYFLRRESTRMRKAIVGISPAALGFLAASHWSGNVRQLEMVISRAVILSEKSVLEVEDFDRNAPVAHKSDYPFAEEFGMQPAEPSMAQKESARLRNAILSLVDANGSMKRMSMLEAETIRFALHYYGGHMSEVARKLGIGRSTLYRKIHDFNIETPKGFELDPQTV